MYIEELNEVFDEDKNISYPVINMNPKYKIPQVWNFAVPGQEFLMARLMQFTGKETVKQYKMGDKIAEVFLMSGTSKGHAVPLKGGLGTSPIDAIQLIFRTVYDSIKYSKPDVVLFRFPSKKMKGQERGVIRVMNRLVQMGTSGRYQVLPAAHGVGNKNAYVIMYRRGVDLLSVDGMPPIPEKYAKTDTKVGEVYTNKETGEQVTKAEVAADTLAQAADNKTDASVAQRTKFSRRRVAQAQTIDELNVVPKLSKKDQEAWEEFENNAAEFSNPATAPTLEDEAEFKTFMEGKFFRNNTVEYAANTVYRRSGLSNEQRAVFEAEFKAKFDKRLGDNQPCSVKAVAAFVETTIEQIDSLKSEWMDKWMKKEGNTGKYLNMPEMIGPDSKNAWNRFRSKILRGSVHAFAQQVAHAPSSFTKTYDPTHYTKAEHTAIRIYCGSAYRDINNFLNGYKADEDSISIKESIETIKDLDSAFRNGVKLPEDVTLWRAQRLAIPIWKNLVKDRVFYFRNFVSTSLYPIIFGGWTINAVTGLASDEQRPSIVIDGTDEGVIPNKYTKNPEYNQSVSVGWAINGAEKINVVYPGKISIQPNEDEVILPRGTMVQINKITDASSSEGMEYSNVKFVQAEIMTNEQIQESTTIYDGDVLMETGELVAVDGLSFGEYSPSASRSKRYNESLQILADLIDFGNIPDKFI